MFKNKKGVSMIIAYVLLVGFSVALAITVTLWIRGMAEESAEDIMSKECELQCDEVFLAVGCYSDGVDITNKGNFNISKLKVRSESGVTDVIVNIGLGETAENLNIGDVSINDEPISIVPVIGKGEEECVCRNKRIEVSECISKEKEV